MERSRSLVPGGDGRQARWSLILATIFSLIRSGGPIDGASGTRYRVERNQTAVARMRVVRMDPQETRKLRGLRTRGAGPHRRRSPSVMANRLHFARSACAKG